MVLGSVAGGVTYPQSLYHSAMGYGFGYLPNALMIEPSSWDDANNEWLASLYGLSYERILPQQGTGPDEVWEAYLHRISQYLQEGSGSPVQVCRGWAGAKEEEGEILSCSGERMFWWEGLRRESRPDMHYVTVVGLDRSKGLIYIHDPIGGWYGTGRYGEIKLEVFRRLVERTPWQHRCITVTFKKTRTPPKSEAETEKLLKQRIIKLIEGDPAVYNTPALWRAFFGVDKARQFEHGLEGLKAFKDDLNPEKFRQILKLKEQRRNLRPAETISWIDLSVYHYAWITFIAADYLEEKGRVTEWEWLFDLHLLYEKLWMSTAQMQSIFKATPDLNQAVGKSEAILQQMRQTIDDMILHFQFYLGAAA